MSVEAVKWAMYGAPMLLTDKGKPDTTARQVLAVLAEHADANGIDAFPSSLKITFATGLDERTIQRALMRLERGGQVARDGVSKHGTTRWRLALSVTRPESEWPQMQAEADRARRAESDARSARRKKARQTETDTDLSGTENPGQPGRRVPDTEMDADLSGTQSAGCPGRRVPDVRDAAPPEPPEQPPVQPPELRGSSVIPSGSPSDASPSAPRAADPQKSFTEEDAAPEDSTWKNQRHEPKPSRTPGYCLCDRPEANEIHLSAKERERLAAKKNAREPKWLARSAA